MTCKNGGEAAGEHPSQSDNANDNTPDVKFSDDKDPVIEKEDGKLHSGTGRCKDDRYGEENFSIACDLIDVKHKDMSTVSMVYR